MNPTQRFGNYTYRVVMSPTYPRDINATIEYLAEVYDAVIATDASVSSKTGNAAIGIARRNGPAFGLMIGDATNNVAELLAVAEAIKQLQPEDKKVLILTDSRYALAGIKYRNTAFARAVMEHVLTDGNAHHLDLLWVPAHSGVHLNECADKHANQAARNNTDLYPIIPDYIWEKQEPGKRQRKHRLPSWTRRTAKRAAAASVSA